MYASIAFSVFTFVIERSDMVAATPADRFAAAYSTLIASRYASDSSVPAPMYGVSRDTIALAFA